MRSAPVRSAPPPIAFFIASPSDSASPDQRTAYGYQRVLISIVPILPSFNEARRRRATFLVDYAPFARELGGAPSSASAASVHRRRRRSATTRASRSPLDSAAVASAEARASATT